MENSCRVTLLIDFVAIKESAPTLASPYTFSGSMSINCNRIPRGGWARIFRFGVRSGRVEKVQRFTFIPHLGYRLTLKYLFSINRCEDEGAKLSRKLWTVISFSRFSERNLDNSVFWGKYKTRPNHILFRPRCVKYIIY